MINNNTYGMAKDIRHRLRNFFDDQLSTVSVEDFDDVNQDTFTVNFRAYDSFSVYIQYNAGSYICYFMISGVKFHFKDAHKYLAAGDYETLFSEIKQELELRLPDKFLMARGWL